jgi:pimeloyl-ACP methyl ester carboxylesterase
MPLHETFTHTVGPETLTATITRPDASPATRPTILLLHGAGSSNQTRFQPLAETLANHGYTTLRFDHSGHGSSSGTLSSSTLTKRLAEARSFLPLLHPTAPLTVMGSSMGAHTACSLLPHINIHTLIAQVPAAYTAQAEATPFGEAFTNLIRTPGSWADATIWDHLQTFSGRFTLITGGEDTVIPPEVIRTYWHTAGNATKRTHFYMPEAGHKFTDWLEAQPANRAAYSNTILSILSQA